MKCSGGLAGKRSWNALVTLCKTMATLIRPNLPTEEVTPVNGKKFFSVKTGLLVRFDTDQHTPNGISSVSISDYRPVEKVLFAFGAAQTAGSVKWRRSKTN